MPTGLDVVWEIRVRSICHTLQHPLCSLVLPWALGQSPLEVEAFAHTLSHGKFFKLPAALPYFYHRLENENGKVAGHPFGSALLLVLRYADVTHMLVDNPWMAPLFLETLYPEGRGSLPTLGQSLPICHLRGTC